MEAFRDAWFNAPDLAAQKKVGEDMQRLAFEDVPFYPLGSAQSPTAYRKDITGVPEGFVIFWNVRRV
jgi:peptide/nickel transport system substrate-binding protein